MKLSFSTNGWDDFDWTDCYATAKDLQFAGIEIHDIKREVFSGKNRLSGSNLIILSISGEELNLEIEIPLCI